MITPTTGYAIFAENMLETAQSVANGSIILYRNIAEHIPEHYLSVKQNKHLVIKYDKRRIPSPKRIRYPAFCCY